LPEDARKRGLYRLLQYVVTAARTVHFAHTRTPAVIHRDLKPDNLLVDNDGNLYVADWGHGYRSDTPDEPPPGFGTFCYVAPEQWAGTSYRTARDSARPGRLADIYSLGAILYHAVTGKRPFHCATDREKLKNRYANPQWAGAACDVEIAEIIRKAMAARPEDRYATAREFADDLERAMCRLVDEPVRAFNPGKIPLGVRVRRTVRRHAGILTILLLMFGLLSVAGLVATAERHVAVRSERERAEKAEAAIGDYRRRAEQAEAAQEKLRRGTAWLRAPAIVGLAALEPGDRPVKLPADGARGHSGFMLRQNQRVAWHESLLSPTDSLETAVQRRVISPDMPPTVRSVTGVHTEVPPSRLIALVDEVPLTPRFVPSSTADLYMDAVDILNSGKLEGVSPVRAQVWNLAREDTFMAFVRQRGKAQSFEDAFSSLVSQPIRAPYGAPSHLEWWRALPENPGPVVNSMPSASSWDWRMLEYPRMSVSLRAADKFDSLHDVPFRGARYADFANDFGRLNALRAARAAEKADDVPRVLRALRFVR
jgi:hypothetical protein